MNTPRPCVERPERLFHGTTVELAVGDAVQPGLVVRASRSPWVWLSSDATSAEAWGHYRALRGLTAAGQATQGQADDSAELAARIRVYEVEAPGEIQEARGHYRAKEATVVAVIR